MCFHSVALHWGNATEWESANGNHSNFHRALASPEHFSAECAAIVIISRLRADKLIQKEGQTVWRAICQFYWNTFIVYIITYFSTCFGTTLLNVLFFFNSGTKPEQQGKIHTSFFFKSNPLLSSLIIHIDFLFRFFTLSVRFILSHFPPNSWRFCQSSILSLALIL